MGIRSGFGAIQKAVEKQESGQQNGQGVTFIGWDGNKPASENKQVIRFIDEEPRVVGMYSFMKCADGKNRDFPNPADLDPPREDVIGANFTREGRDGKQIPLKPSEQGLSIAAVREEVKNPDGPGVISRDVLVDVEVSDEEKLEKAKELAEKGVITLEGKTVKGIPKVGIVKQSVGNFWKTLNGYWTRYETITDRDYEISRTGKKLDTDYTIVPIDKDEKLASQEAVNEHYAISCFFHPTVDEWLNRMGSEDRINFHLFGKDNENAEKSDGSSSQSSEPAQEKKPETTSSLQDQISGILGKK